MDLDRLLSFMMKRDMVVKEATSVFNSKYYAFTHKIQISGETSAEWLVNYLHESIHYYINGFPICNLRTDIAFLFNYLHYYYVKRKGELLIENEVVLKNNREVMEDVQYVIAYQHEIDLLLSRDDRLVEFCKYCIDIYNIYLELLTVNRCFNEGLATFYSLNVKRDSIVFDAFNIPNIFSIGEKFEISENEILDVQKQILRKIIHDDNPVLKMNVYEFGYEYTYLLSDLFGDKTLLSVLIAMMANINNIYGFDLIGSNEQERNSIIRDYFSLDKMYLSIILKMDEILSLLSKEKYTKNDASKLFKTVTNHDEPGMLLKGDDLFEMLDKRFFKHPMVVEKIEMVLGRKITELDHANASLHMSLQYSGKTIKSVFESEQVRSPQIDDLKELMNNQTPFITDIDKYAEINFEDAYKGMKAIVKLAEEDKQ